MNELIPTAYFQPRPEIPDIFENLAKQFRAIDPDGSKAMELLRQVEYPACPCCHRNDKVELSPKPNYGEFFCPCNAPGPQYFNRDGSGTLVGTDPQGKLIEIPYFRTK